MSRLDNIFLIAACTFSLPAQAAYETPLPPYSPQTGVAGSQAVIYSDERIAGWATEVITVTFGEDISEDGNWKDTRAALGPPNGDNTAVLVLGRGGSATLEFGQGISNGPADDFVVFENPISRTFLELAFVEVSSDGEHFVRFPNYSATPGAVEAYGSVLATNVHGFAGKHSWAAEGTIPYGTPFDLSILEQAYHAVVAGYNRFSTDFAEQLTTNFPFLDTSDVRYVRLVDVIGDGSMLDCEGYPVYDPYPTWGTAGFDLDAVAVINTPLPEHVGFSDWSSSRGLSGDRATDHDQDGWKDGIEYQFGTDPADRRDRPALSLERDAGSGSVFLVIHTSAYAEGGMDVLVSSDGASWQQLAESIGEAADPESLVWINGRPLFKQRIPLSVQDGRLLRFQLKGG